MKTFFKRHIRTKNPITQKQKGGHEVGWWLDEEEGEKKVIEKNSSVALRALSSSILSLPLSSSSYSSSSGPGSPRSRAILLAISNSHRALSRRSRGHRCLPPFTRTSSKFPVDFTTATVGVSPSARSTSASAAALAFSSSSPSSSSSTFAPPSQYLSQPRATPSGTRASSSPKKKVSGQEKGGSAEI